MCNKNQQFMAKVLVIRKTDRSIHKVNPSNEATLKAHNNRSKLGWTFELMDEEEANKLPFIDTAYVTAGEAQEKVKSLEQTNNDNLAKIKEMEEKLAALSGSTGTAPVLTSGLSALHGIEAVNNAATAHEVTILTAGETRTTVLKAAEEKIASFTAQ